jgi:hypothetical protein
MTRNRILVVLAAIPLAGLIYWVASNTYWEDMKVPMPPKGEALTNPFYAAQRFAEALGARTAWDRVLAVPPSDAVIVLSGWHWTLSSTRRTALERWVESGGRLVVDWSLSGGQDEFFRWSGVRREFHKLSSEELRDAPEDPCRAVAEEADGAPVAASGGTSRVLCHYNRISYLATSARTLWILRDVVGIQAVRVPVGRGHVTVINAVPFSYQNLFEGDHASIFVAATELRRGDAVHFLSENDHPSLLALMWQYGSPFVVLALAAIGFALWRSAVRFGPLAEPPSGSRRSLGEQIRGTGQFALRHGGGDTLHEACARALEEAAKRRVPAYARLPAADRTAALSKLTGFERDAVAAALHHAGERRPHVLRSTLALLETARRLTLSDRSRSRHGRH